MHPTTRRIAIAAASLPLALAGFAVTGPAAFAGKPAGGGGGGATVQALTLSSHYTDANLVVDYTVPALPRDVRGTQCSVDAVTVACGEYGWVLTTAGNPSSYQITRPLVRHSADWHTYTVKVTTKRGTYAGSVDFFGTGS